MATRVSDVRNGGPEEQGPYVSLDDRLLVLDFQAGNEASAFAEIHHRYSGLARHIALRILQNADDAEEATQETMLRVFQGLPRFNGRYLVQPWVARIATNVSLDILRAKNRRPQSERSIYDLPDELDGHVEDPEELVERVLESERVREVLDGLPSHHRDALILREFQGRSHEEIGESLGVTPAQAKALIHRAKGTFRRAWDETGQRGRGIGVLVPWLLAPLRLPQFVRRLFGSAHEAAAGIGASASQAATSVAQVAATPVVVTSAPATAERVTAAAMAVVTAAAVSVGAVAVTHRANKSAPVASPVPAAVAPAVVTPPREQTGPQLPAKPDGKTSTNHRGDAKQTEGKPVVAPVAEATPSPSASPSPDPSPSAGPSVPPTPPPPPPAPAWSATVDSTVPIGSASLSLLATRVDGSPKEGLIFAQTAQGPVSGGQVEDAHLEYWGSVEDAGGWISMWLFLDTAAGTFRYDATGSLVATTLSDEGVTSYTFTAPYALTQGPAQHAGTPMPHDGVATYTLRFWPDGTLYQAGLSLDESGA